MLMHAMIAPFILMNTCFDDMGGILIVIRQMFELASHMGHTS